MIAAAAAAGSASVCLAFLDGVPYSASRSKSKLSELAFRIFDGVVGADLGGNMAC
jgi:hypothetical protein